jgi:hypothetical protein
VSLRLRLLAAVGLIAIVALVVADFATYSALRNTLYNQVDQQLSQRKGLTVLVSYSGAARLDCGIPYRTTAPGGQVLSGNRGNSGPGPVGNTGPGPNNVARAAPPNVFGVSYLSIVRQNGDVVGGLECPAYVGNRTYRPQLPGEITGFTTQSDGTQVAYFTASSIASDGPAFRVQATKIDGGPFSGDVMVQAQPLTDQLNTLHTLFLTEFAVTAAAIVFALLAGWWLVRLGLRPLAAVEATSISACRAPRSRPRSAAWPGPSTSCSNGSRARSTPGCAPSPS